MAMKTESTNPTNRQMVKIEFEYQGALRCEGKHAPSGATIATDAPVDNHGRGESFSPTDLVATALGSCMMTLMGIVAQRHDWDIAGTTAVVEKRMVATPERRIGGLDVVIRVPQELPAEARAALERAALTCPVHRSLHPECEIPVCFLWGAAAVAGEPQA